MAYIGKQPVVGNFQKCDAISVVNGQAAYTLNVGGAAVSPENANHMLVSLNGVLQAPGDSFTVSGSTLTFASNLATGDVIDFVIILGDVLDLGTPSDNSISTAKLVANSVTAAKFNADVISGQTALAEAPADTDEFLVSDGGVIKRIDYSLIKSTPTHTLLATTTVSSSVSQVDFTSGIDSTYKSYMIDIINCHFSATGELFEARFFQGGSVVTSAIYDTAFQQHKQDNNNVNPGTANNDAMQLISQTHNNNDNNANCRVYLLNPADTTFNTHIRFETVFDAEGDLLFAGRGGARIESTTAVDGIRFFPTSGTIDSGIFKLYGIT